MSRDEIIRLSEGGLHAELWPAGGGRVTAFYSVEGGERFDWMVPAPQSDIARGATGSWGSFPLVPFSNRIRDARFEWDGEIHHIEATEKGAPNAIHGHGRSLAWTVERASERSVSMSYRYVPGDWPFAYRAEQEVSLEGGVFSIELRLTNESEKPMPAGLGHHPYFPWRGGPVLKADFGSYWPAVDGVLPAGPLPVPDAYEFREGRPLPRGLDTGFSGVEGAFALTWPECRTTLDVSVAGGLGHVILFSPDGRDFFCAEPVTHSIDAVNLAAGGVPETGLRRLEAGASMTVEIMLRPTVF
ncbi:aldose 1-epimerase [Nisaea acidiphila]|uniref:Aldose 1-epimerase n=1 Tax=Nisaea acidiphila TaxID=1862145 RepID=A0A9J7ARG2_9PROT|nr:aldose 1-epimerase [Nisaea acidiphila]UUX49831.1 aldose 1-epimerase [Nisaea acidiphila]